MHLKASTTFIFCTVALDMIGIGLIVPSLPDIMRRFLTDEAAISQYFGWFISVYALMQFFASPLLGAMSDFFGRRPILLVSVGIAACDYLLMAFAPTLTILFIGRIIAGLTGANITVAWAYIADVSTKETRSANFGIIGAAFGLGFILGPAIGGLLGHLGPQYPFIVAAGLNVINFLFGVFVLPESLPKEKRRKLTLSQVNPFQALAKVAGKPGLIPLLSIHFLLQLAGQTHPSIWTLYTKHRFAWTTAQVGFSLAAVGALSAIAQGGLTRLIVPRLGERRVVMWGALGMAVAYLCYGAVWEGWMLYVVLIVSSVCWVVHPALQSLMSSKANSSEQGELQGAIVSLSSLASILNPLIVTQLFSHLSNPNVTPYVPGSPYFFAATSAAVGWIVFLRNGRQAV